MVQRNEISGDERNCDFLAQIVQENLHVPDDHRYNVGMREPRSLLARSGRPSKKSRSAAFRLSPDGTVVLVIVPPIALRRKMPRLSPHRDNTGVADNVGWLYFRKS
jgi:hypothetical protein